MQAEGLAGMMARAKPTTRPVLSTVEGPDMTEGNPLFGMTEGNPLFGMTEGNPLFGMTEGNPLFGITAGNPCGTRMQPHRLAR